VLLDYRFDGDDPFQVRATCLVDHDNISLRVIAAPVDPRFQRLQLLEAPTSDAAELPLNQLSAFPQTSSAPFHEGKA
jgi:hypothetical protein